MRFFLLATALAGLLAAPALAQPTPNTSGGGSTNGASGAAMTPPSGSFAPAANAAAGTASATPYTGTRTHRTRHHAAKKTTTQQ